MSLIAFLNNVNIIKCGVGIYNDARKLKADYNLSMCGAVDLNHINNDMSNTTNNPEYLGLERLSKQILNKPMLLKHNTINHSHWESTTLSPNQIHYACDDAMVAYNVMQSFLSQSSSPNTIQLCFGNIDTHHGTKKLSKTKQKQSNNAKNRISSSSNSPLSNKITVESDENGMIRLLSVNQQFLTLICQRLAKNYVKKKWAKLIPSNAPSTIQMLFAVTAIDPSHDLLFKYQRVLCMTEYRCMVCGERDAKQLMWFFLVYRYLYKFFRRSSDDPYKVLVCKACNKHAVRWIHDFHRTLLDEYCSPTDKQHEYYQVALMRDVCRNLKHARKRREHNLTEQTRIAKQVMEYCEVHKAKIEGVVLVDEWWLEEREEEYELLWDCIEKICERRIEVKTKCNNFLRDCILRVFDKKRIALCELFRHNFMVSMSPKFYNHDCEAFEFCVAIDNKKFDYQRFCKHKLISMDGGLLTRTCAAFVAEVVRKRGEDSVRRINNTTVQILFECEKSLDGLSEGLSESRSEPRSEKSLVVWMPFTDVKCHLCCGLGDGDFEIYDVLGDGYRKLMFSELDGGYGQCYVPVCVPCMRGDRIGCWEREFELALFGQWREEIEEKGQDEAVWSAFRLAQKRERFGMSADEQNGLVAMVLEYFEMDVGEVGVVKDCDCNKELGLDWFGLPVYGYQVIRECVEKLVGEHESRCRELLARRFEKEKLAFVQLWVKDFVDNGACRSLRFNPIRL